MAIEVMIAAITAPPTPRPTPTATSDSSTTLSILALVVSVLSLVATATIGILQYRAQARVTAIERGRRADEISLANSAELMVQWQAAPPTLIVRNRGQAAAGNVRIAVSSATPDHPPPGFQSGSRIPLDALGPGESYAIPMTNPYGMAAAITAELRWHDGTGEREKIVPLSLPAS